MLELIDIGDFYRISVGGAYSLQKPPPPITQSLCEDLDLGMWGLRVRGIGEPPTAVWRTTLGEGREGVVVGVDHYGRSP